MNRFVISVCCGLAILASSAAVSAQSGPSVTGTWNVQQTGVNGTTTAYDHAHPIRQRDRRS